MQKTAEAAQEILNDFSKKWKPIYPKVVESISGNPFLLTFYSYPKDIRCSIYSTNLIENFNKHLKRDLKAKIQFPSEESMGKIFSESLRCVKLPFFREGSQRIWFRPFRTEPNPSKQIQKQYNKTIQNNSKTLDTLELYISLLNKSTQFS